MCPTHCTTPPGWNPPNPESRLAEVFDFIHFFRLALSGQCTRPRKPWMRGGVEAGARGHPAPAWRPQADREPSTTRYLLDTSALRTLFDNEPGADRVDLCS